MSQSPFLQMPLHLIRLVLSELDNIQSLGSAILSHSTMYAAFNEDPKAVSSRILFNQIPPNLISHAGITYEVTLENRWGTNRPGRNRRSRRQYSPDQKLWNLLSDYHEESSSPCKVQWALEWEQPNTWLAFASSASKTHKLVEYFTDRFLNDTLPLAAQDLFGLNPRDTKRPSEDELFRIRRAFYRFQFYCNLTCDDDNNTDLDRQQDDELRRRKGHLFFRWFSPWVNEQLACIHDYLEGVLSKAFDEVAAHDVAWGAKSVDWISRGKDNKYKQAYLSYGLGFLLKIDRANSYEERLQLLAAKNMPCSKRGLAADLLENAAPLDDDYEQWGLPLGQWSTEDINVVNQEHTNGPDGLKSAPFQIWRYIHWKRVMPYSIFQRRYWRLRQYGYVLWEFPASKAHRKAFRDEITKVKDRGSADVEPEGAREEMERSWAERAEVLSRGGRGYWARGDLTRVVWDDGANASGSEQVASL